MATATELMLRACSFHLYSVATYPRDSGTAGGTRFGVAKSANLIAVKVLSDAG